MGDFDDQRTAVEVDRRILEESAWIFYVSHGSDGGWSFLPHDHRNAAAAQRTTSTLGVLLLLDASLESLADLPQGWHAWRQSEDSDWQRTPIPTGPTFLISYEASPTSGNPERSEFAGAFIQAWVRCGSLSEAQDLARTDIESCGWRILTEEGAGEVQRSSYEGDPRLRYFEQAQTDGAVFLYDLYRQA